jgi:hypothetical protein
MSDFEEKVKKEIEKTGLPTEILATKALKDNGWNVFNEYPYLDREENKIRTLDINANKTFLTKTLNSNKTQSKIELLCELYIECKKSVKSSWVFFTEPMPESFIKFSIERLTYDVVYGIYNEALRAYLKSNENLEIEASEEPITIFSKIPVRFEKIEYKIALSHQAVFGNKENKKEFYEAVMQLLKSLYHRDLEEANSTSPKTSIKNNIILPIILFNGNLFECYYDKGQLCTPQIQYTRYLAHGLPNQRLPALIDVMPLDYFPNYLKLIQEALAPQKESS